LISDHHPETEGEKEERKTGIRTKRQKRARDVIEGKGKEQAKVRCKIISARSREKFIQTTY